MSFQINIHITADDTGVFIHGNRMRPNGKSTLYKKLHKEELDVSTDPISTIAANVSNITKELIEE